MLGKLIFLHVLILNKNDILKTAIENQYKNFFYRKYELWDMVMQSNKDLELIVQGNESFAIESINTWLLDFNINASMVSNKTYNDLPNLPLNYSESNGQFLYDNVSYTL